MFNQFRWVPLLAVVFITVACGGAEEPAPPVAEQAEPTQKVVATPTTVPQEATVTPSDMAVSRPGGIVALHKHGPPRQLDPHVSSSGTELGTFNLLYSGLLMFSPQEPTTEVIGDLAKDWKVGDDGLSYTFNLNDAKWSDGTDVTAEDVAFSIDRMVEEGEARPKVGLLRNYYDRSEVLDPKTVKVFTGSSAPAFLPSLAVSYMKILPKAHVSAGAEISKGENIIGSGPFRFVNYVKGDRVELESNPGYFKPGLPKSDGINQYIITDTARTVAAFEQGQVLMTSIAWSGLSTQGHLELDQNNDHLDVQFLTGYMFAQGIFLNHSIKPFSDVRVRQALFLGTDRRPHVEAFTLGTGHVGGPLPSWLPWGMSQEDLANQPGFRYTAEGIKDPQDIEEAKRLLAEAGFPDGLELTITCRQTGVYCDQSAVVQDQWRDIGVTVKINSVESASGFAAYEALDFEAGIIATAYPTSEADAVIGALYMPGGDINYSDWEDPKLVELYNQQSKELDSAKRTELLSQIEEILLSGSSQYINLMWYPPAFIVSKKIKGWALPPSSDGMHHLEYIYAES
jgi:peptide/nickel transport system substrate-binding protein